MLMFLTIAFMSLFALAVTAIMFSQTETRGEPRIEQRPGQRIALDPPQFFAGDLMRPHESARLPLEMLLSQIERHVRLEQAAAETFLAVPNAETLHSRSTSPLAN